MTRTILTPEVAPGTNASVGEVLTFTAWDSGNGNRFLSTGKELLLARNDHATVAKTVTVTSVADPYGRTGNITAFSLVAAAVAAFGPFQPTGWRQSDGYIYVDGESTDIKFCVITLP